jgi:Tfp pilus assembly protein PilF
MKQTSSFLLAGAGLQALALLGLFGAPPAGAQLTTASAIRGQVKDAQGQPIAGVNVELEFRGESRVKILKKTVTDKKGGYIYSGLLPGAWIFRFTKQGYKPTQVETSISLGGLSDIPPVTMSAGAVDGVAGAIGAAAGAAPAGAPGTSALAPGPADSPGLSAERQKELADKYTQAMVLVKAGSHAEAETLLKEIVTIVPAFAPAHQALASVYVARGDMSAAEASYRKVVELDAQSAASFLTLANFLATQNRYEDAFKVLQDAAPQFAQHGVLQFALGAAAFNLGRTQEAQAAFTKAVELDPANPEPHFYLGSLAVSASDVPRAVAHFEKYIALAPAGAPNLAAAKTLLETLKKK